MGETSSSSGSSKLLNALRNETKNKFDSLLKAALSLENDGLGGDFSKSTERLVEPDDAGAKKKDSSGVIADAEDCASVSSNATYTVPKSPKNVDSVSARTFIVSPEVNPSKRDGNKQAPSPEDHRKGSLPTQSDVEIEVDKDDSNEINLACGQSSQYENKCIKNYSKIVVHYCEKIQTIAAPSWPAMTVHVVSSDTGEYLKKSASNGNSGHVEPITTRHFDLKNRLSSKPVPEVNVVIKESFDYVTSSQNNVIIFFELIDKISASGSEREGKKIAWAFMKLIGKDGTSHANKRAQLRLYKPGKCKRDLDDGSCVVYEWWKREKWIKFRAALSVTVTVVTKNVKPEAPVRRSECLKLPRKNAESKASDPKFGRSRLKLQVCKLPNKLATEINSYDEGTLVLKFSHDGDHLAYTAFIEGIYMIIVYSVLEFKEVFKLGSHQGIIYSVVWSEDDKRIISASADGIVGVWDFTSQTLLQMLPHPSYVYTSEINSENVIATGCSDSIVRVWTDECGKNAKQCSYILSQELEGHEGYVTSVHFGFALSSLLYSADSRGLILEWSAAPEKQTWILRRRIALENLRDAVVDQILPYSKGKKLIINTRDGILRILDLKTECVVAWLGRCENVNVRISCSCSPCENFIFRGGKNGTVNVWRLDTGKLLTAYFPWGRSNNLLAHCVHFNPQENLLAISHYGRAFLPILMYSYDNNPGVGDEIDKSSDYATGCRIVGSVGKSENDMKNEEGIRSHFKDIISKIDTIILPEAGGAKKEMLKYPSVKENTGLGTKLLQSLQHSGEKTKGDVFSTIFGQRIFRAQRCRLKWTEFFCIVLYYRLAFNFMKHIIYMNFVYGAAVVVIGYVVVCVILAMPLFMFNLFLGHFTKHSFIKIWEIVPLMKGVGYSVCFYLYAKELLNVTNASLALMYIPFVIRQKYPWSGCKLLNISRTCYLVNPGKRYTFISNFSHTLGTINGAWVLAMGFVWIIIYVFMILGFRRFANFVVKLTIGILVVFLLPLVFVVMFYGDRYPTAKEFRSKWSILFSYKFWLLMSLEVMTTDVPGIQVLLSTYTKTKMNTAINISIIYCIKLCTILVIFSSLSLLIHKIAEMSHLAENKNMNLIALDVFFVLVPVYIQSWTITVLPLLVWFLFLFVWSISTPVFTMTGIIDTLVDTFPVLVHYRLCLCTTVALFGFSFSTLMLTDHYIEQFRFWRWYVIVPLTVIFFVLIFITVHIYTWEKIALDYSFVYNTLPDCYFIRIMYLTELVIILTIIYKSITIMPKGEKLHSIYFIITWIIVFLVTLPIITVIIGSYAKYLCFGGKLPLEPSPDWGPPDQARKKARKRFNPKKEVHYSLKMKCDHNCLLRSAKLKKEIAASKENEKKVLEYISQAATKKSATSVDSSSSL